MAFVCGQTNVLTTADKYLCCRSDIYHYSVIMKIKTVFSDFGLFADEKANFFQYRRTDGRFIVRPLQPYLKNEHLELLRFEKEDGVFYAPVQLRRSGRKLVSRLMDVVGGHRFYKLLGEGLAFCEKGHLWRRGCRFEICEWRIFFPDAFGDLVEVTRRLVDRRKAYICAVESENGVLSVKINAFADGITTCCYRCEGGDCILQERPEAENSMFENFRGDRREMPIGWSELEDENAFLLED